MIFVEYNRLKAVNYAKRWARSRNPKYYDYSNIGGDCTNFISQCVFTGCGVMNYDKNLGWYYINANEKSPSWTGVKFFYDFIVNNDGTGPYGEEEDLNKLMPGDIIQLGDDSDVFYHTLILTNITRNIFGRNYYICSHSMDTYQRNLFSYDFSILRGIHIIGARKE